MVLLAGAAAALTSLLVFLLPSVAAARGVGVRADHVFHRIAGSGARFSCDRRQAWYGALGVADRRERRWFVLPVFCREANWFHQHQAAAYSRESFRQALALLVMTHESIHLSRAFPGAADEARTECLAIQLVHGVAIGLGASEEVARAIGHESIRYHERLPKVYHHSGCRDGGPLDIHPGLGDWPNA